MNKSLIRSRELLKVIIKVRKPCHLASPSLFTQLKRCGPKKLAIPFQRETETKTETKRERKKPTGTGTESSPLRELCPPGPPFGTYR